MSAYSNCRIFLYALKTTHMYAVRTHIEQSVKDKTESEMIGKENANKISLGEAFQENSPFEN